MHASEIIEGEILARPRPHPRDVIEVVIWNKKLHQRQQEK